MKRLHKNMLTAGVLLVGGVVIGLYTLQNKVKTPEARFRDSQNSKRLFPKLGRNHVQRGTFYTKTATVSFERDDKVGWKIVDPIQWPADLEAIDAALDRMAAMVVDPVITEDASADDLERVGLDRPEVSLFVELKDGKTHTLHVGPRNKLADRFPVTNADEKRIGLSEPTFQWALDRTLDELRGKRVFFPWTEDSVTAIRVFEPDGTLRFELKKAEDGWVTAGSDTAPVEADSGARLLLGVAVTKRLNAEAFLTDDYDPNDAAQKTKLGLDKPLYTLEVAAGDDVRRAIVAKHAERKDEALVLHLEGTGSVVEIKPTLTAKLDKKPSDLRDRTILRFDKKKVHRIRFEYAGGAKVTVSRKSSDWIIEENDKPAKVWKIDGVVRAYAYLKGEKIHTEDMKKANVEEWLLDPFSRRVTFESEDGETLGAVRIGKYAEDELMFVMADGGDRVLLVKEEKVDILPKGLEDITDEER